MFSIPFDPTYVQLFDLYETELELIVLFFFFFFYTCSVFPHCIFCFWYSWSEYRVWVGRLDRVAAEGVHHQGLRGPLLGCLLDEEPE